VLAWKESATRPWPASSSALISPKNWSARYTLQQHCRSETQPLPYARTRTHARTHARKQRRQEGAAAAVVRA
jgi:hypothetical protein